MSQTSLVFVYNADSGLFNTVTDIAHKIFSPDTYECQLCALTYGVFSVQQEWTQFIKTLDRPLIFLHRNELESRFGLKDIPLPVVFSKQGDDLEVLISQAEINACKTLDALKSLITQKVAQLS